MKKRIVLIVMMLLVTAYLAVAFTLFNHRPIGVSSGEVKIVISDSTGTCFITSSEVARLLKRAGLYPSGGLVDSVKCHDIEKELEKSVFIERAECFKTPSSDVCIHIVQRLPVLRILSLSGEDYYVDENGKTMPGGGHAVHLPVATGHISRTLAEGVLHEFALLLRDDSFWSRQIEQIYVTSEGELELVPRVGEHILFLGKPVHLREKLDRLRTFYDKGLSRVGWDKYSRISVEFDNQVICKRR